MFLPQLEDLFSSSARLRGGQESRNLKRPTGASNYGMNSRLARMFILSYTTETDPKGGGVAAKHVEEGKRETRSSR